jgi:hypothetical protein
VVSIGNTDKNGHVTMYEIYENLLLHHSDLCKAIFEISRGESLEGLTFEETPNELFGMYIDWLFVQRIRRNLPEYVKEGLALRPLYDKDGHRVGTGFLEELEIHATCITQLWFLARSFITPVLQNQVIDELENLRKSGFTRPSKEFIEMIRKTGDNEVRSWVEEKLVQVRKEAGTVGSEEAMEKYYVYEHRCRVEYVRLMGELKTEIVEGRLLAERGIQGDFDVFTLSK